MFETNIEFPKDIYLNNFDNWIIDLENPYRNIIQIEGRDYIVSYLNFDSKSNKGRNSYIFLLHSAQEFEEKGYDDPALVLKISKVSPRKRKKLKAVHRFENEVKALFECDNMNFANVIKVYHSGKSFVNKRIDKSNSFKKIFLFYTMEYANFDLKDYIEDAKPNLYDRISLCLEIANGIKELRSMGYYHRDLKPDNIFMTENTWKIGDLGLLGFRDEDYNIDSVNELIGPRGWFCPEAMNKYLTEEKGFEFNFDCKIDHQSDIFQLGKVFWYILQGNAPIGCVKPEDFKIRDMRLYAIIRTMLNHSKKKRYERIEDVIKLLYPIHVEYFKQ